MSHHSEPDAAMNKTQKPGLLDAVVRVDKLPAGGRRLKVTAQKKRLAEIARYLKVAAVKHLSADLLVTSFKGGIRVSGKLAAGIVQPCVVTLDPVVQAIDEPLERVFLFGPDINANAAAGSENFIDLSAQEIPEPFAGDELDLSATVFEVIGLAIELYPRLPGAKISAELARDNREELSPFAVLRSKKPSDNEK